MDEDDRSSVSPQPQPLLYTRFLQDEIARLQELHPEWSYKMLFETAMMHWQCSPHNPKNMAAPYVGSPNDVLVESTEDDADIDAALHMNVHHDAAAVSRSPRSDVPSPSPPLSMWSREMMSAMVEAVYARQQSNPAPTLREWAALVVFEFVESGRCSECVFTAKELRDLVNAVTRELVDS